MKTFPRNVLKLMFDYEVSESDVDGNNQLTKAANQETTKNARMHPARPTAINMADIMFQCLARNETHLSPHSNAIETKCKAGLQQFVDNIDMRDEYGAYSNSFSK